MVEITKECFKCLFCTPTTELMHIRLFTLVIYRVITKQKKKPQSDKMKIQTREVPKE